MSKVEKIIDKMEKLKDEQLLEVMFNITQDRLKIFPQFIQSREEDPMIDSVCVVMTCGDKFILSDPQTLDWPVQPLPKPDAFGGSIN